MQKSVVPPRKLPSMLRFLGQAPLLKCKRAHRRRLGQRTLCTGRKVEGHCCPARSRSSPVSGNHKDWGCGDGPASCYGRAHPTLPWQGELGLMQGWQLGSGQSPGHQESPWGQGRTKVKPCPDQQSLWPDGCSDKWLALVMYQQHVVPKPKLKTDSSRS